MYCAIGKGDQTKHQLQAKGDEAQTTGEQGELHNSHCAADNVHTVLHVHSNIFMYVRKLSPIAEVVPQDWSPSPWESRIFRPQYRGNTVL